MRKGIAFVGSVIVDKINEISAYPAAGELTQIKSLQTAIGGCVPNVALDLKRICPDLPVRAIGRMGSDEEASFVGQTLEAGGVDIGGLHEAPGERTSFTEVMSIPGGQRTFFTYAGAGGNFGLEDMDYGPVLPAMLHLGYFLLLQKVDDGDGLKILKDAKEKGIRTSIDLVSENSDRYGLVLPCLPYTDYLIVNELEAGKLAGIAPENRNLPAIAEKLRSLGVREKVIIHKPDLSLCLSDKGLTVVPSYQLPEGYIKGTTGAGDAFCAGALLGIYEGWKDEEILAFASGCAVMALGSPDATSGLTEAGQIRSFCKQFIRQRSSL
jgi:sugar/nucleoside kinase (ribokinase family)